MILFDRLLGLFSHDMGIDLGTCNTLVYLRGKGVVVAEPSVVAVWKGTNEVINNGQAVGLYAKRMVGRTPGNIVAVRPLKDGVISDLALAEALLRYFINKVHNNHSWSRPRVIISYPNGITEVEKKAITISAMRAGARKVYLVPEPLAAAVGVGMQTHEPTGNMIVNIGGGTTEVAIISMSGMVDATSLRIAGDELDGAIVGYVKRQHNLIISDVAAERIKIEIGSAFALDEELKIDLTGRDQAKGLPRSIVLHSEEIREAIKEPVAQIVNAVLNTLEAAPPDLAGDIYTKGIFLAGGGALLRGLDRLITQETKGIPVHITEDPLRAVVRGTGWFLDNLNTIGPAFESSEED
ncbi:rod shape-determining protein [Planctomycetales bacterium]|nr:rod shape-determining protein [Planctomycetales bacterium]GHS97247.1 rod shape-determining protein [Planctomycetales bacterium]GHT05718.1 rod shape-determining protein [Planctomycetales bacterium]GHV21114.1 rod shape-determining protein [Planctomycetales bacterium]